MAGEGVLGGGGVGAWVKAGLEEKMCVWGIEDEEVREVSGEEVGGGPGGAVRLKERSRLLVACAATAALMRRFSCSRFARSSASEAPFMNAHNDLCVLLCVHACFCVCHFKGQRKEG